MRSLYVCCDGWEDDLRSSGWTFLRRQMSGPFCWFEVWRSPDGTEFRVGLNPS